MKKLWDFLTIYDKILIFSLIILSLIAILVPFGYLLFERNGSAEEVIVIQTANKEQKKILMSSTYREEPLLIEVNGPIGISIIEAQNGKVRLKEAPPADPEKICEKTGWIEQVGPMIICVPNQVSIWIEKAESSLDGVSW